MSRDLFGTDGVRGEAGKYPLDSVGAERIGRAVGMHFGQPGQSIVVGYDPRESSEQIVRDVTAGLMAVGITVVSVGVIATPGLAYITRQHDEFIAGVMVTASHNPYQYNGIKVFAADGGKLNDEVERELNRLIESEIANREQGEHKDDENLRAEYEDFLVASAQGLDLQGLSLAIDMANGATSGYAAHVFERLGASVTSLFDQPNGKNINAACGATDVTALQNCVIEQSLQAGIAFDGDADRLIMVDEKGRALTGDHLLYILAVANGFNMVVATVMSNIGFEHALQAKGITLERTAVGDRYVLEHLAQTQAQLGGEQSGHIILPNILKTGDGLLAAIQVLRAVQSSGKTLATWYDEVVLLPQALVNIRLTDKSLFDQPDVQAYINTQVAQLRTNNGRLLIRPSGTEPLVRVMVEANDAETVAKRIADELVTVLGHDAIK